MTTPPEKLTAADVDSYLASLDLRPPAPNRVLRDNYRAAAAVLAAIQDPGALRALDGTTGEAARILGADLVQTPATRSLGGSYMLSYDTRREALRKLETRDNMLKALDVNPAERTGPVQRWFEMYLNQTAPPLAGQSIDDLDHSLQAILWLDGLNLPGVPSVDEVRLARARAEFRQPFERLAGAHFRGRAKELDTLRNFVGILEPQTLGGTLVAGISRLLRLKPKPALTLYGPGGIGKSALVCRFFLEHVSQPEDRRVPFAYLDFDSSFLNINDLSTIATEIFRQLSLQLPNLELPEIPTGAEAVGTAVGALLDRLASRAQQPFLMVLDTFEEVQYGGEARAAPLWEMLNSLQSRWPFLRVLISGRAPVQTLKLAGESPTPFPLEGLDESAAVAIVSSAGIKDTNVASALVKQVGRVPLSLRLAASLVKAEGASAEGVSNLVTTSYFFLSVSDEVIQGQLYERILAHIHDPDVVKVAHPGLVLRRITSDLILKVLKEPCGLSISTPTEADALYAKLARETALVTEEKNDGSLLHRTDLRRTMLKLLVARQPRQAEDIHRRARDYYASHPEAKAEHLYHRLMLGERPSEEAEALRSQDIRRSLSQSMAELPVDGQIFLSELGYDVAREVLEQATKEQRESHLAARIGELLPYGSNASALGTAESLLSENRYRGANSPLYLAEARLRVLQNRRPAALDLVEEGLRHASVSHDLSRVLDLLCLKAWILEEEGQWADLPKALSFLGQYVERLDRPLPWIQLWSQRLRLALRDGGDGEERMRAARELSERLPKLGPQEFVAMAPCLKGVFGPVTAISPQALSRLAPFMGHADPAHASEFWARLMEHLAGTGFEGLGVVNDPKSAVVIADALPRILAEPQRASLALEIAAIMDAALASWPYRLPYVSRPPS